MIPGIKFAGIPVLNLDAALNFYAEKLGFKVVTDQPFTVPAPRGGIHTSGECPLIQFRLNQQSFESSSCNTDLLQTSLGYSRRV
jgi:catechol 2,3-dioxygenase-like lactoylglutathione lyase family enzyme